MHTYPDTLGDVMKAARQRENITVEELAEKLGVTDRYIYRIENEGQHPSYNRFMKIVRILDIDSELICHPEKEAIRSEFEPILRMLCNFDPRSLEVVKATIKALIDTASEK